MDPQDNLVIETHNLTKLGSNITGALVFIVALSVLVSLGEIYRDIHQVVPFLAGMDKIAQALVLGNPLPAVFVSQVISAAVLSIVFILVALWRFQHIEL